MYPVDLFVKMELIVPIIISDCSSKNTDVDVALFQISKSLSVEGQPGDSEDIHDA